MAKERIDVIAVQQGLADSREKAKRMIMAGLVYDSNNLRYDKPGEKVADDIQLHVKGETLRYVSRGGLKLEKAIKEFSVDLENKIVLDIGSSTGGFTDAALQNGAKLCYALDVGTNQLAWKLRQDDRVIVMEQVNFRYSKLADFQQGQPEFASIDVSFISLRLILPVLKDILAPDGATIALIKPQFEAGREKVGKKGIVSDPAVHKEVLHDVLSFAMLTGFSVRGLTFSPITGGSGNVEFLAYFVNEGASQGGTPPEQLEALINQVIKDAHYELKNKQVTIR